MTKRDITEYIVAAENSEQPGNSMAVSDEPYGDEPVTLGTYFAQSAPVVSALTLADLRYMERLAADFLGDQGVTAKRISINGRRALVLVGPSGMFLADSPAVVVAQARAARGC